MMEARDLMVQALSVSFCCFLHGNPAGSTLWCRVNLVKLKAVTHFYDFSGWWLSPTPLKNMKVNFDDYSQYMENKSHVPNHQPV